jgi:hypothetical protein
MLPGDQRSSDTTPEDYSSAGSHFRISRALCSEHLLDIWRSRSLPMSTRVTVSSPVSSPKPTASVASPKPTASVASTAQPAAAQPAAKPATRPASAQCAASQLPACLPTKAVSPTSATTAVPAAALAAAEPATRATGRVVPSSSVGCRAIVRGGHADGRVLPRAVLRLWRLLWPHRTRQRGELYGRHPRWIDGHLL